MNSGSAVKSRREVALDNLKAHIKTAHTDAKQLERHMSEINVLEERIKSSAKFGKYLRRKPSVKQAVQTEVKGV